MKSIQKGIFLKVVQLFTLLLLLFYALSYTLLHHYIGKIALTYKISENLLLSEFNSIFLLLGGVIFLFLLIMYFIVQKLQTTLQEDVKSLQKYVVEISEYKNYEAPLHIKHYLEFLSISVTLKNIVKRLRQKEKKASKK